MAFAHIFLTALFALASRSTLPSEATPVKVKDPHACQTPACYEDAQMFLDYMDTSVDPCDDFFRYACGGWIEKHPIPDEKSSYSTNAVLTDQVQDSVAELIGTAADKSHLKPILDAAILFQGCIDEEARETQGLDPLKEILTFLGGWPMINPEWSDAGYHWQTQVATITRIFSVTSIISFEVAPDLKHSSQHVILLDEPSFGLPREQLINLTSSERNEQIITAYRDYIISTGKLLNPNIDEVQLSNDADEIIELESALAQYGIPDEEKKDIASRYNKMTVAEVETITENVYFKWADFLNNVLEDFPLVTDDTEITIFAIDYIKNAIKLAHNTPPRILANYIGWILLKKLGASTTKDFRNNEFHYKQMLTGIEKPEELEDICTEIVVKHMSFAVGRLYVDKYFTEEEKNDLEEIVHDILSTYEITFTHNTWMDPETKSKALEKLRSITTMMGYPAWIKNDEELTNYYSSVPTLNKDEFFASLVKVMEAESKRSLRQWNQPTHRTTDWITPPSEVNAFSNPLANTITFPAGILHLPYYKHGRSLALNYGAIGSVIGHEITHGFDNSGSKYDKEGNLENWWSEETMETFEEKTNCFKLQYSSCVEPTINMSLNGNNTIADDIADNGGVRNAFIAYKMRILQLENEVLINNERLPGVSATPDQLFFLGYASTSCGRERKESIEMEIQYGDHTLEEFRVTVPLSNSIAFAETFNCPVGCRMNPESKCVLW